MTDYDNTWERLGAIDYDALTIDQQIEFLKVQALLSINQELSGLNPQNTTTNGRDGIVRNGWGFPLHV